ncbi:MULTISPECIES: hypothetical protein [Roseobacteraceae]|uniref:LysR family transcriptional regulator n=1 Tax=Phaeobacter inhibens TaxID=221822 RepID=A0A2I7KGE4_9RHOB|nr:MULTISPECIES: hypothetical protein [Roseobacteraceae]AUR01668.1 hypothetical protein PhaeoP88_04356 [Phaeobacter inhibens]
MTRPILPGWLAAPAIRAGTLEQLLPDHTVPSLPVNLLTPPGSEPALRVRCLIDHLVDHRAEIATLMAG